MPELEDCWLQEMAQKHNFGASIKPTGKHTSDLSFHQDVLTNLGIREYFDIVELKDISDTHQLSHDQFEAFVKDICKLCALCDPIFIKEKLQIIRTDYVVDVHDNEAAYEVKRYPPRGTEKKGIRVCVLDDEPITVSNFSSIFADNGFSVHDFTFDPDAGWEGSGVHHKFLVQEIISKKPDWVIFDKGLGCRHSGIDILRDVRRESSNIGRIIGTIMVSGEINTAETSKASHLFYEKPVPIDDILDTVAHQPWEVIKP